MRYGGTKKFGVNLCTIVGQSYCPSPTANFGSATIGGPMAGKINKILVACIFAFSLVLVCSVAMAATQSAQIVGTKVNIRTSPNTSSSIITKLSNSRVSIVDKSSDWYKISFSGKTGWVNSDYIKVLSTNGKINANGVNFRTSASTTSKVIDSLSTGTSVAILDTRSGWLKVKVGSKVGYVVTKFVTITKTSVRTANSTAKTANATTSTAKATVRTGNASVKTSRSTTAETFDISDDSAIGKVIAYAKEYVGVQYVYGGKSPNGFDCSGFIGYVYKHFGIKLNSSAASMYSNGTKVSKSALRAGDILFFDASSRKASGAIDHVGIYLGDDLFIHASSSNGEVRIQSFSEYRGTYLGAKRVI
jgi:cell wall-associated NlpC family hydrolase